MKNKQLDVPVDEFASPLRGCVALTTSFEEVEAKMMENNFRHVPVVEQNRPVGIISKTDMALLKNNGLAMGLKAKDFMTPDPYCVRQGTSIEEAAFEMSSRKIGSAIVVNSKGEADSIFTSIDGLNALIEIVRGDIEQ